MLKRLVRIAAYNRDWPHYVLSRFRAPQPGKVLTFRLRNGQRLALKYETRFLLNEIYLDRVYDRAGIDYSECTTVLDLGGNVGVFAMYVAARNPQARIYSFEPASENLALLRQNLEANPTSARQITTFPMAVGASNGRITLSLTGTPAEYSTTKGDAIEGRKETVRCVDLATVFELCDVDEFDLAKIDIEGAEASLLEAATDEQLRRFKAIVLEWHYSWESLQELAARLRVIDFDANPMLIEGHMRFLHARRRGGLLACRTSAGSETARAFRAG
jgi:FkbM family methyltransferase